MLTGVVGTQHVEAAEHPATARRLLVGDGLFLRLNREIGVEGSRILTVCRQGIDAVDGHCVDQRTVDGFCLLLFLDIPQHLAGDASWLGLGAGNSQAANGQECTQ